MSRTDPPPVPLADVPAAVPLSEELDRRFRHYALQMALRFGCFLLIPFVPGYWKFAAAAGAVILPMIAVILANRGRAGTMPLPGGATALTEAAPQLHPLRPDPRQPAPEDPGTRRQLPPALWHDDDGDHHDDHDDYDDHDEPERGPAP